MLQYWLLGPKYHRAEIWAPVVTLGWDGASIRTYTMPFYIFDACWFAHSHVLWKFTGKEAKVPLKRFARRLICPMINHQFQVRGTPPAIVIHHNGLHTKDMLPNTVHLETEEMKKITCNPQYAKCKMFKHLFKATFITSSCFAQLTYSSLISIFQP